MTKIKKNIKETKNNLKMVWNFIKPHKKVLVYMTIISIILSIISIILPILNAKILYNLSNSLLKELFLVSIYIFIIKVIRNISTTIMDKITDKYIIKIEKNIQIKMFEEILKIETHEFDKNTTGTFIDRITNDTVGIIRIFSTLIDTFIDFISNIGVLLVIFYINKYIFIYFILTNIITNYIDKVRREKYIEANKNLRKIKEKRTSLISEIIRGIRDVKLLNANKSILNISKERLNTIENERKKINNNEQKYSFISYNTSDFFDIIFFALGIILVTKENLTISNFIILYTYRNTIDLVFRIYNRFATTIQDFNLSATRVFEVLEDKFDKEENIQSNINNLNGNIEFKNVTFAYEDKNVLKNISFKINKGDRIGFVGKSGSGKTTIFNLITKLYKNYEGEILIDNINIKNISYNDLRKNISLISQNPYIFNFSIKDNLKITNQNASEEEITLVTKKADIYKKIMQLDNKFDTIVGEGGVILSGGEKQRLAIARSLLKNSNIILFDEATSSLDNISQNNIQKAIYGLDKEKTILIIAHRLSTIINCDKIIVIDDGKIIDIGNHKELLKRCKKYQELYNYEEKNIT